MILAAGRGERLRPWTDTLPKPLLTVGGKRLIEHHLFALAAAGFEQAVINVAYKGELIEQALGDGSRYGLPIRYSREQPGELDTGGGIRAALDLLCETAQPFLVVNADILSDFPFARLKNAISDDTIDAYPVLAPNPPHHQKGDFGIEDGASQGWLSRAAPHYTFTGIGVYRPRIFERQTARRFGLAQLLFEAIDARRAQAEIYTGQWHDVGTPEAFKKLGGQVNPNLGGE